jgi:TonB family protein
VIQGAQLSELSALLNKVFISRDQLATRAPNYWREFLTGKPEPASGKVQNSPVRPPSHTDPVIMQSKIIAQPKPQYPLEARAYSLEGIVVFTAEIDERGEIDKLMILRPAGVGFDENAADAVYKWKYTPTFVDGVPVRVITTITVNFQFQR